MASPVPRLRPWLGRPAPRWDGDKLGAWSTPRPQTRGWSGACAHARREDRWCQQRGARAWGLWRPRSGPRSLSWCPDRVLEAAVAVMVRVWRRRRRSRGAKSKENRGAVIVEARSPGDLLRTSALARGPT